MDGAVRHRLATRRGGKLAAAHVHGDVDLVHEAALEVIHQVLAGGRSDMLRPQAQGHAPVGMGSVDLQREAALVGAGIHRTGDPAGGSACPSHGELIDGEAAIPPRDMGRERVELDRFVGPGGAAQDRILAREGQGPGRGAAHRARGPDTSEMHGVAGSEIIDAVEVQDPLGLVPADRGGQALDGDRVEVLLLDEEIAVAGLDRRFQGLDAAVVEPDLRLGRDLQVGLDRQFRLPREEEEIGDRQVVQGDDAVALSVAALVQVTAEAPFPVRAVDAQLEHAGIPHRVAPEQTVHMLEHPALARIVVDQREATVGDPCPVEGSDHAGGIEHDAEDRCDGGRDRRRGAPGGVDTGQGVRFRRHTGRIGTGKGDGPVAVDEGGHLQVAELDGPRLDGEAQQTPGIQAHHRHGSAQDEGAVRVVDVEAGDLKRQGILGIELDGAVAQVHPPTGADTARDGRGHTLGHAVDAQGTVGQTPERAGNGERQGGHENERAP